MGQRGETLRLFWSFQNKASHLLACVSFFQSSGIWAEWEAGAGAGAERGDYQLVVIANISRVLEGLQGALHPLSLSIFTVIL